MLEFDLNKMLFNIPKDMHNKEELTKILKEHPEIQFVSYAGLDMVGNDTDERIPARLFLDDMDAMLAHGVQTDGSSVNLPKIAELNNAKVDMIPDFSVNWYIDYNFDNIDRETGLPVGTLRIPAFLIHNDQTEVGSRVILRDAVSKFKEDLMSLLAEHPYVFEYIDGADSVDDIEEIRITSATELEFWVKTPDDKADREQLSTSQELKEQYWKRTYGPVRTALEKSIEILDRYGIEMEMGHKEVGGVKSKITSAGTHDHIMEQLEIDWKYSDAMQACDNEKLVRYVVRDVFNQFGLNTNFMAKPIVGVAGNGEHTHLGVMAKLKNGKMINLFEPIDREKDFMSPIGYGSLMGILRNYEILNPFVAQTHDAFQRLKPGYEAPVCVVTSLGRDCVTPSRNRTVLIGVVRDMKNPMATRFELRSPNPHSNTYLIIGSAYMLMLDGIRSVLENKRTPQELEKAISKKAGEEDIYLEKDRRYRSEENVFTYYTEEEREQLFGKAPATVWENFRAFDEHRDELVKITGGDDTIALIIRSYRDQMTLKWSTEFHDRLIPNTMNFVRQCVKAHTENSATDYDIMNWRQVNDLRHRLGKDYIGKKSILSQAKLALDEENFQLASDLELEIQHLTEELRDLYNDYQKNLF